MPLPSPPDKGESAMGKLEWRKTRVLKYLSFAKFPNPYHHVNTLLGNGGMWFWSGVKLYHLDDASLAVFKEKDTKLRHKIR